MGAKETSNLAAGSAGANPRGDHFERDRPHMLGDQVRDLLLSRILTQELAPGARIVETRIARELGISQGPVREALRDLTTLGLVELLPYRGARVRRPTPDEIREAMRVRAELEALAAAEACPGLQDEHLAALERVVAEMAERLSAGDLEGYARRNTEFHRTVVRLSGNRTVERMWEMLVPFARTYMTAVVGRPKPEWARRVHLTVVRALATRDPRKAAAAMRAHLAAAQARMDSGRAGNGAVPDPLVIGSAGAEGPGRRTR